MDHLTTREGPGHGGSSSMLINQWRIVDFETAEHLAIREQFPNATIHGCLFHFKQAIIRHYKTVLPAYGTDGVLISDFCAVFGLAFVPVADIEPCWILLKDHLTRLYPSDTTNTLITYLESTWLYSNTYTREMWNMYQSVLDGDPRTNNVSEGGNNSINIAAGCSHPKIIPFIIFLQRYNAEQEAKLRQFETEQHPNRRRRNETLLRDQRIFRIVSSYDGRNLLSYLRRIGNLYQWIFVWNLTLWNLCYINSINLTN